MLGPLQEWWGQVPLLGVSGTHGGKGWDRLAQVSPHVPGMSGQGLASAPGGAGGFLEAGAGLEAVGGRLVARWKATVLT